MKFPTVITLPNDQIEELPAEFAHDDVRYTQELVSYFVNKLTKPGDLVYDPFMGSGTTAIACEELGRRWIGSELSPAYYKKASRRIKDFVDPAWKANIFLG